MRALTRPLPLVLVLALCSSIPVLMSAVRSVQIPLGALPAESLRLQVAPVSHLLHAMAGVTFGLLGPVQFAGALRRRLGRLHRVAGRAFAVAGVILGLSGLGMLAQVDSIATALLDVTRAALGTALVLAVCLGVRAARAHDRATHRAWMIRAYAIGIGGTMIWLAALPLALAGHAPLTGLTSDIVYVALWLATICVGEWVIRQPAAKGRPAAA